MTTATRNAFFYGMSESISETAIAATLSTARYTVLAYDLATSDEARQAYRWVKDMGIALGQLAFWSVVWAYAKVSAWAEAEVASCLFVEDEAYEIDFQQDYDIPDEIWNSDPDHVPGVSNMVEADPFSPDANPHHATVAAAAIAAPVATLVVTAPKYHGMTTVQLRKACQAQGIKWRNAHAKGKHLSKGEMLDALS